jgi:hypothetical protein
VLLGGGVLLAGVGVAIFPKDYGILNNSEQEHNSATFATILSIGGLACMITSIPFFVSSSANKRRARLKMENKATGLVVPLGN